MPRATAALGGAPVYTCGRLPFPPKTCRIRGLREGSEEKDRRMKCQNQAGEDRARDSLLCLPSGPRPALGSRLQDSHSQHWEARSFSSRTGMHGARFPGAGTHASTGRVLGGALCGAPGAPTQSLSSGGWQSGETCYVLQGPTDKGPRQRKHEEGSN